MKFNLKSLNKGKVVSLNSKAIPEIKKAGYPLFLTGAAIIGIVGGVLLVNTVNSDILSLLLSVFTKFNAANVNKTFLELFSTAVLTNLAYLFVCALFGLCAVGAPFIVMSLFVKGLGTGLISGCLYGEYAIDGLEYCVLMLYPAAMLLFISLIIGGTESLHTIHDINSILFKSNTDTEIRLRVYLTRYMVPLLICLVSAVINAVTVMMFSDLFSF